MPSNNTEEYIKFDCVIANPPYQEMNGGHGASADPLYHKFVEFALDIVKPEHAVFITPSRWMAATKMSGLVPYMDRMRKDKQVKEIVHFNGAKEVFPGAADIEGGVSYFHWEKGHTGPCTFNGVPRSLDAYSIIPTDNQALSILDKVLKAHAGKAFVMGRVLGRKPFGLATNFSNWQAAGTVCWAQGQAKKFVDPNCFTDSNGVLGLWKVLTSTGYGERGVSQRRVMGPRFLAAPQEICTETYIVLGAFKTRKEAELFQAYTDTKLFRFLLAQQCNTQHVNKGKFAWVPDRGSYSGSPLTDATLCAQYGLTQDEVAYIESKIL